MPRKPHRDEEDEAGDFEECPVCHQEFSNGICPLRSADCPYLEDEAEEDELFEEEDENGDEEDASDEDDEN